MSEQPSLLDEIRRLAPDEGCFIFCDQDKTQEAIALLVADFRATPVVKVCELGSNNAAIMYAARDLDPILGMTVCILPVGIKPDTPNSALTKAELLDAIKDSKVDGAHVHELLVTGDRHVFFGSQYAFAVADAFSMNSLKGMAGTIGPSAIPYGNLNDNTVAKNNGDKEIGSPAKVSGSQDDDDNGSFIDDRVPLNYRQATVEDASDTASQVNDSVLGRPARRQPAVEDLRHKLLLQHESAGEDKPSTETQVAGTSIASSTSHNKGRVASIVDGIQRKLKTLSEGSKKSAQELQEPSEDSQKSDVEPKKTSSSGSHVVQPLVQLQEDVPVLAASPSRPLPLQVSPTTPTPTTQEPAGGDPKTPDRKTKDNKDRVKRGRNTPADVPVQSRPNLLAQANRAKPPTTSRERKKEITNWATRGESLKRSNLQNIWVEINDTGTTNMSFRDRFGGFRGRSGNNPGSQGENPLEASILQPPCVSITTANLRTENIGIPRPDSSTYPPVSRRQATNNRPGVNPVPAGRPQYYFSVPGPNGNPMPHPNDVRFYGDVGTTNTNAQPPRADYLGPDYVNIAKRIEVVRHALRLHEEEVAHYIAELADLHAEMARREVLAQGAAAAGYTIRPDRWNFTRRGNAGYAFGVGTAPGVHAGLNEFAIDEEEEERGEFAPTGEPWEIYDDVMNAEYERRVAAGEITEL
ncbi:MAG: hypothetical protein M1820_003873 [Bogoriella megaspora]|nr:MAG: hypothetical protein M1820_003873 [Bogoriella megaspora]